MKKIIALLLIIILAPLLSSCTQDKKDKYTFEQMLFGPTFSVFPQVTIVDTKARIKELRESGEVKASIKQILDELDATYDVIDNDNSLISQINQKAGISPVTVTDEVINIIKTSISASESTKVNDVALYDITILPVWELWNFDSQYNKEEAVIPTQEDINNALPLINYQNIIIDEDNKTVFLSKEGMKIDLGSIVKGYACDKIKAYLLSKGYKNAIINVGGNIMTFGYDYYDDREWLVKISTPFANSLPNPYTQYYLGHMYYNDVTVVTSGTYERFITSQGIRYHHILNPKTGYPVNNGLVSVSIITNNSMQADAYSTSVFCMGLEEGVRFVEGLEDVEAVFVTDDKEIYITSGLEGKFNFNTELESVGYTYKGVKNGTSN